MKQFICQNQKQQIENDMGYDCIRRE